MIGRAFAVASSIPIAILFASLPSAVMAECDAWELLPKFNAVQANGFNVVFEVHIADGRVKGSAHYYAGDDFHRVDGGVDGTFNGEVFDVVVSWPVGGAEGRYVGGVSRAGKLSGVTKDIQRHEGQVNPEVSWFSKQTFRCAQTEPPPPPPPAASPEEKAGVFENQQKGIGAILKETKP